MFGKRELIEYFVVRDDGIRLQITLDIKKEEIFFQEIYANGEESEDILNIKRENVADIIKILEDMEQY